VHKPWIPEKLQPVRMKISLGSTNKNATPEPIPSQKWLERGPGAFDDLPLDVVDLDDIPKPQISGKYCGPRNQDSSSGHGREEVKDLTISRYTNIQ